MSNQQSGAWQGTGRQRSSASRTPQNRSGTGSPSQQAAPSQPPRSDGVRSPQQANNVWTQRGAPAAGSNGLIKPEATAIEQSDTSYQSVNGFNAAEVKAFLKSDATVAAYQTAETTGNQRSSGGAWGSKPSNMANNQPFFVQLAKQIATLEGGG